MKNILTAGFILTLLIFGYLVFFNTSEKITNYPSAGESIVAFGDSLVEGVGATEGNDFVSLLSEKIDEPIINLGVSGDTTRDGLKRLDEVLEKDPKVVLLLLGGNDYLRKVPQSETFTNLGVMIEAIHESGAVVVLLGVRGGILKDNFANDYEELADRYGTAYIPDVLDGLIRRSDLMSDKIHPNNAGYQIIADRIYPVLEGLLK